MIRRLLRLIRGHGGDLEPGEVYYLLSNDRRRATVEALQDEWNISVRGLAKQIAAEEFGSDTGQDYKRVYVSLWQQALPTLQQHEVVEFNSHRVSRARNFRQVSEVVRSVEASP